MLIALWTIFALLLACWSGVLWAVQALLRGGAGWTAAWRPWLDALPGAEVLERVWPGWRESLLGLVDLLQTALAWLGGAPAWLDTALWLLWGAGALPAALVAGVLHAAIRGSGHAVAQARA